MNKEIDLDGIDLSIIPDNFPIKKIVNRIDHAIELFNINTHQKKKLNVSILIPDQSSNDYYGVYLFCCTDQAFFYQTLTHNIYETYQTFRQPYEAQGWRFRTKGARANAQVSGMLVSYGGFNAYLIERIDQITFKAPNETVDIFEADATVSEHDTVIAQKAFHEQMWRETIESARKRGIDEDLLNYARCL